jgi:hypothetical protein
MLNLDKIYRICSEKQVFYICSCSGSGVFKNQNDLVPNQSNQACLFVCTSCLDQNWNVVIISIPDFSVSRFLLCVLLEQENGSALSEPPLR